jgi:hypothetical protein
MLGVRLACQDETELRHHAPHVHAPPFDDHLHAILANLLMFFLLMLKQPHCITIDRSVCGRLDLGGKRVANATSPPRRAIYCFCDTLASICAQYALFISWAR